MNMRHVPPDEAEDVRRLLEQAGLEYYETPPGPWGISAAALWLVDDTRLGEARTLIDRYQQDRAARARQDRAEARRAGTAPTMLDELLARPLRLILYLAAAAAILYFSTAPFIDFGQ